MFLYGVCLHAGLSNVHVPRHRGSGLLVSGGDQIQPEDIGLPPSVVMHKHGFPRVWHEVVS